MLPLFFPAVFITLLFFLSSFEKIYLFPTSAGKFAKKLGISLPLAQVGISGAIILEMVAPLIIYAYTFTGLLSLLPLFKMAVIALILFTIVVTLMYHNPLRGREKYYAFMSNVSTLGGLMALYLYA
jgi:hypothetical protein